MMGRIINKNNLTDSFLKAHHAHLTGKLNANYGVQANTELRAPQRISSAGRLDGRGPRGGQSTSQGPTASRAPTNLGCGRRTVIPSEPQRLVLDRRGAKRGVAKGRRRSLKRIWSSQAGQGVSHVVVFFRIVDREESPTDENEKFSAAARCRGEE